jgi:transcriptional regulator with XRE-family HTH domain
MEEYNVFDSLLSKEAIPNFQKDVAGKKAVIDASSLIFQAMEEKGFNQTELAKYLGVSKGYVSRLIAGNENLTVKNVAMVLHALGKEYNQTIQENKKKQFSTLETNSSKVKSIVIDKPKIVDKRFLYKVV